MKFLFISYKKLNTVILLTFFAIIISAIAFSIYKLIPSDRSIFTISSTIKTFKTIDVDSDGNGRKDRINIKIDFEKKEYNAEIISDTGKKYMLLTNSKSQNIGPYLPWWPLKITIADVNMDKIPEIILQVSDAAQDFQLYIFRWNGKEYKIVLSGSYNGITIADTTGDGVPEIITEQKVAGTGEIYTTFTWAVNSYRKINSNLKSSMRGYDKIQYIIKLISVPYEEKFTPDVKLDLYFTNDWIKNTKNIGYLKDFSKDIVGIQLQDYIGEEIKPSQNSWKLRYIVFRKFGTDVRIENYTAEVLTEKIIENPEEYKIKKIIFKTSE